MRVVEPTSESQYGIVEQPEASCPLVDKAIKCCKSMTDQMRGYEKYEEDELRDTLAFVENELGELLGYWNDGVLEQIRSANIAIRDWGQQWKQICKDNVTPEQIDA